MKKNLKIKENFKTVSMIIHRKDIKKQNVKNKEICLFYERSFLHKLIPKTASIGLHKKDMEKWNLKVRKNFL